ncbi:MAG: tRNA (N6-threonylcarbamoyladenosine(37)-N6)-methyltransferase TrmO [Deltaproteobacteria bacterium]|nr:MAG: tRNA (N6-threonylcarbamoyladenosine(37)-N6)-methyltransferase TrmO [Deltaproteobacteria bacterium]
MKFEISPIGIIHTPFKEKSECPVQTRAAGETMGRVELLPELAAGLKDIELFTHIYLFYIFDRAGEVELLRHPFLDDEPHGIFATRHPCRPTPLGLSIVELLERRDNMLTVKGIDVLDGTPLIDIKPYAPKFDEIRGASNGWLEGKDWRHKPEGRE